MAARKTRTLSDSWRQKIQTTMLINRLQGHVKGEIKLESTQVNAALGLLKKTAPDLTSTTLAADDTFAAALKGIKVTFEP